ncbi:hypothetical protein CH63R_09630 [Colletotrichum higginsianum IMI 349063]|uniref:Uncharacterized protein n=1 Tax=Colletotrichum higginsianum (strain IMI 349063) TaxID=759273 RepID=A0A1B7Y7U6_COLHI|nr:hypothetical protein CH63R_09630 [Colletotrichum higginsianum IMI 349063]OBR08109.1 hypothetical protein CH63R_09630 [Colletotrichum higginsianum IMI 349063]GJC97803.1 hypothetical protein ColKHC_06629 [Colletotrichum higginsianum]
MNELGLIQWRRRQADELVLNDVDTIAHDALKGVSANEKRAGPVEPSLELLCFKFWRICYAEAAKPNEVMEEVFARHGVLQIAILAIQD